MIHVLHQASLPQGSILLVVQLPMANEIWAGPVEAILSVGPVKKIGAKKFNFQRKV